MITMLLHAALVAAVPVSSVAAERWLPFTGCWRAESAPPTSMLCVVAAGESARLIEIEDGVTRERRIQADGVQRPVSVEGCSGFESARWSRDGERLFLRTVLKCGENAERKTSGIFAFTSLREWVSIEAVTVGDQGGARTVRYHEVAAGDVPSAVRPLLPVNQLARETARYAAARPVDFEDLRETVAEVEPRAAEALIIARGQPFNLTGRNLVALADAGLPEFVIDAMVAVSYPEVFEVRKPEPTTPAPLAAAAGRTRGDRYCDSFTYAPWLSVQDRYLCGRGGYFGYDYYGYRSIAGGYYSPWGYYNTPVIIIRDRDPAGGGESSGGRASRNGYRRGAASGSDSAQPRSGSTPSASRPASASSGSSDSGSSGSSGSGRTAKPRDN